MLTGPSPHDCSPLWRAPIHSIVNTSTWYSHEEIAAQAAVGSIVWAFRRLKKSRSQEMSARGYALHSVSPKLSFYHFSFLIGLISNLYSLIMLNYPDSGLRQVWKNLAYRRVDTLTQLSVQTSITPNAIA